MAVRSSGRRRASAIRGSIPLPRDAVRTGGVVRMTDCSVRDTSVERLLGLGRRQMSPSSLPEIAAHMVELNHSRLSDLGVSAALGWAERSVAIRFTSSGVVGAVPLRSPLTGQDDLGLLVEPRFTWSGIGPAMAMSGWRVIPAILRHAPLPYSARDVPPWLLASTVLGRVSAMLQALDRRFDMRTDVLNTPHGQVRWAAYAGRHLARGRPDRIPCRFPYLDDDQGLLAAIHYVLRRQLVSLGGSASDSAVINELHGLCQSLLSRVAHIPPRCPTPMQLDQWLRSPLKTQVITDGVEAMDWTIHERGLAGQSDLRGLPWSMPMEVFWESWVEMLLCRLAARAGGTVQAARRHETTVPVSWDPPYTGSLRSLAPDLIWRRRSHTVIVDAKYKQHWSDLTRSRWSDMTETVREHHRADIHQVLAYAHIGEAEDVTVMLAYPCRRAEWRSLATRASVGHTALLSLPHRRVRLILAGLPLEPDLVESAVEQMHGLLSIGP